MLDELLTDRRGNRRGFPPEIRSELQALRYAVDHPADTGLDAPPGPQRAGGAG